MTLANNRLGSIMTELATLGSATNVQDMLGQHRTTTSKLTTQHRRQLKRLANSGAELVATTTALGAQAQSELVAVLETLKAQTRTGRQMREAGKVQQQALLRTANEAEARGKDLQRQLRQAVSDELEGQSRTQAKRQQQLMQVLTVLSNDV